MRTIVENCRKFCNLKISYNFFKIEAKLFYIFAIKMKFSIFSLFEKKLHRNQFIRTLLKVSKNIHLNNEIYSFTCTCDVGSYCWKQIFPSIHESWMWIISKNEWEAILLLESLQEESTANEPRIHSQTTCAKRKGLKCFWKQYNFFA